MSYAVLGYGGTLGIGQKLVAVPLTAFHMSGATDANAKATLVLNATKDRLEMAKGFDKDNWPSVSNPTWGADKFWEDRGTGSGQFDRNNQFQNQNQGSEDQNRANPQQ